MFRSIQGLTYTWNSDPDWLQLPEHRRNPLDRDDTVFEVARADARYRNRDDAQIAIWLTKQHARLPRSSKTSAQQAGQFYKPISDANEIRVLTLSPGKYRDNLTGSLRHITVDFEYLAEPLPEGGTFRTETLHGMCLEESMPVWYTALSYSWGYPALDCPLVCDGHSKNITKSLDVALRHLRHEDWPVNVWADLVCINQDDDIEKGQQVQLMQLIYKHALNTVIWLGPDPDDGAFYPLRGLWECLRDRTDEFSEQELEQHDNELGAHFTNLEDIFKRPWFGRLWVIQEVVLSKQAYVMSGKAHVPWREFATWCDPLVFDRTHDPNEPDATKGVLLPSATLGCSITGKIDCLRTNYVTGGAPRSLLSILADTREATATDPRDKLYGVLGICNAKILPNYKRTSQDLWSEVALEIIHEHYLGCLLVQLMCCVDHEQVDLPSWVPDWSKQRYTTSLAYSTSTIGVYKASPDRGAVTLSVEPDSRTITLTAICFDTLTHLSDVLQSKQVLAQDGDSTLHRCAEFVVSRCHHYTSQTSTFTAFWQTLVAGKSGCREPSEPCPDDYAEIWSFLLGGTPSSPMIPGQTYSERQLQGDVTLTGPQSRRAGRTFDELRIAVPPAVNYRKLAATRKGYLGLVPRFAEEGDCICVVRGCHVPLLLRQRPDGDYTFLGECYVSGIMEGEVKEMPDLQPIDIRIV